MRPGKNTKSIMKRMNFREMMARTESLILWPVDEGSDVLRIDKDGEFIYNCDTREVSTPYLSRSGKKITYNVKVLRFGKHKSYAMHRLVASTFCPRTPERDIVHHIDRDRSNNRASNLLWTTDEEHAALHRLLKKGEQQQYAALVARIRHENEEDGTEYLEVSL